MIKKFETPSIDSYAIQGDWLVKKIQYYANHINDLQENKLWAVSDFRRLVWIVFELRDLKRLCKDKGIVKDLDKLLNITSGFEIKYDKYFEFKRRSFYLKHNKDLFDVIDTESHSDEMLFKLIEWDKRFMPLAQSRILKAQAFGDKRFFNRLANSIKKGTDAEFKKIKTSTHALREAVAMFLLNTDINLDNPKAVKSLCAFLFDAYTKIREDCENSKKKDRPLSIELKNTINQCDEILEILNNENYFISKWLPRHVLGKDTKKPS